MIDYSTGKIVRPGSKNRVLNYVPDYNDKRERKWEFQNPKSKVDSIITQPHLKHFKTQSSNEYKQFAHIKRFPQPNSKRIILSYLLPENKNRILSPIKRIVEVRKEYSFHKRRGPEHIYNNNFTLDNSTNHKYLNIIPCSEKKFKKSVPLFNEYINKSQIVLLPGSIKRKKENINDDLKKFEKIQKKKYISNKFNSSLNNIGKEENNINNKTKNLNFLNKINDYNIKKLKKEKTAVNMKAHRIKRNFKISINDDLFNKDLNLFSENKNIKNKNVKKPLKTIN